MYAATAWGLGLYTREPLTTEPFAVANGSCTQLIPIEYLKGQRF